MDCTRRRQTASLLSHAFCDLPFSISMLTDSLVYLYRVWLAARNMNVSGVFFPRLSLPLPFPWKKTKQNKTKKHAWSPVIHARPTFAYLQPRGTRYKQFKMADGMKLFLSVGRKGWFFGKSGSPDAIYKQNVWQYGRILVWRLILADIKLVFAGILSKWKGNLSSCGCSRGLLWFGDR